LSFRDRQDAGRRLAAALLPYRDEKPIILALPRGGVPVAAEVARVLDAPLDLLIVRKIGLPQQPELAAGAVVDGDAPLTVRNEEVIRAAGLSDADFSRIEDVERAELRRRRERYLHGRSPASLNGRTVIVVDDGIATGATVRAALRALRKQQPARLILAVPVAPSDTIRQLESEADRIECLESHGLFDAIGSFYDDFRQVSDDEVIEALDVARSRFDPGTPRR
jgi:predicted phosphoribosyltransferase